MRSRSFRREPVEKYCSSLSSTSSTASNVWRTRSKHSTIISDKGEGEDETAQTIHKPQGDEGDVYRRISSGGGISARLMRSCCNTPIVTSNAGSRRTESQRCIALRLVPA